MRVFENQPDDGLRVYQRGSACRCAGGAGIQGFPQITRGILSFGLIGRLYGCGEIAGKERLFLRRFKL